jgi:O-antigen ligase
MSEEVQIAPNVAPPTWLEYAFVTVILLLLTGAFMNLFISPEQQLDPGEGMPGMRYIWAAIYAGVYFLWRRHCRDSFHFLLEQRAILLLTALAIASAAWSDSPATTLRRCIALVGTLLMALYFANRFRLRRQLEILAGMFGACLVLSFVFGALHLGHSVDGLEGVWIGIYAQRNELGTMMVFASLVFLVWGQFREEMRRVSWILVAAAFWLIMLSGSITSILAFGVLLCSIALIPIIRRHERTGKLLIVLLIVSMCAGWWLGTSLETLTATVGRDATLTGRTELWGASLLFGLDRPLLGYGYNAFWLGLEGPSEEIWQIVGWAAPSAHNGLLEIWLDLGLAGVAIAIWSFGSSLRKAYQIGRHSAQWQLAWPLLFLVILFVMNLTESTFFEGNSIYWFLYVVTALNLARIGRSSPRTVNSAPTEAMA